MSPLARRVARVRRDLHGHYWTMGSFVRGVVRPASAPHDLPFSTQLHDPVSGTIEVTGRLAEPPGGARDAVVVIHGLGGDVGSRYVVLAARAALDSGLACLRLHLRGADLRGADVYHAALIADLEAALAAPQLARFERLYVLGYSLGGHVALHWAASRAASRASSWASPRASSGTSSRAGAGASRAPAMGSEASSGLDRVRAVAAVCPPVDLAKGVRAIQRVDRRPYQFHVLRGLKAQYEAVARRHGERTPVAPITIDEVRRLRTIVEWDEQVIAPRYGFAGAEDYYEKACIVPRLADLEIPTLFVAASADPMIPSATVRPGLARASDALEVVWVRRGGHVGFPDDLRLGLVEGEAPREGPAGEGAGIEREVIAWLRQHR